MRWGVDRVHDAEWFSGSVLGCFQFNFSRLKFVLVWIEGGRKDSSLQVLKIRAECLNVPARKRWVGRVRYVNARPICGYIGKISTLPLYLSTKTFTICASLFLFLPFTPISVDIIRFSTFKCKCSSRPIEFIPSKLRLTFKRFEWM